MVLGTHLREDDECVVQQIGGSTGREEQPAPDRERAEDLNEKDEDRTEKTSHGSYGFACCATNYSALRR